MASIINTKIKLNTGNNIITFYLLIVNRFVQCQL